MIDFPNDAWHRAALAWECGAPTGSTRLVVLRREPDGCRVVLSQEFPDMPRQAVEAAGANPLKTLREAVRRWNANKYIHNLKPSTPSLERKPST